MPVFHRFDPTRCAFPAPRVSILPHLGVSSLALRSNFSRPRSRWFRRGRYALMHAYRQAGIGNDGALLAPSYHCRTMLDGAVALGAEVRLFPVHPNLSPDLSALEELISRRGVKAKALLLPHYFGFAQNVDEVLSLCEQHGVKLIEDCSHVLVGVQPGGGASSSVGGTGHYAVSSPYKFFPTPDGGLLWSNRLALAKYKQSGPGFVEEMKALANAFARKVQRGGASISSVSEELRDEPREWIEDETVPSTLYKVSEENDRSLAISRLVARHTDVSRVMSRRRAHYRQWLDATRGLAGCRALFDSLPDDCVPYMFPLLVNASRSDFFVLKKLGVPIWRWDEMAVSECATASSYRLSLLHLPCHQELASSEMEWMTAAVTSVCGSP